MESKKDSGCLTFIIVFGIIELIIKIGILDYMGKSSMIPQAILWNLIGLAVIIVIIIIYNVLKK